MNTKPFRFAISDLLMLTCFSAVVIAISVSTEFYATLWTLLSLAIIVFYNRRYSQVQGGIVRVGLWVIASIFFCEAFFSAPFPFGPSIRTTCFFSILGATIGTILNVVQSSKMPSHGH